MWVRRVRPPHLGVFGKFIPGRKDLDRNNSALYEAKVNHLALTLVPEEGRF